MGKHRRIIGRACIFLVLGAIINVAVAWGFAVWTPIVSHPSASQLKLIRRSSPEENQSWQQWTPKGFSARPILSSAIDTPGLIAANITADRTDDHVTITPDKNGYVQIFVRATPPQPVFDFGFFVSAGWPMHSLHGARFIAGDGQLGQHNLAAIVELAPTPGSVTLVHAIPVEERIWFPREYRILPTCMMPMGFAINTIFYAAVLWVLFAVPVRVRRWRRIKRGQCASCGYSLRGTSGDTCPECGKHAQHKACDSMGA